MSLHQKFLKIPNEDAGKSSWWTINPDSKLVVKQKRRSTYGECVEKIKKRASEVAKSRGRVMKSTSLLPYATDTFRNRSNSSASSCDETSRLSADESVLCPSPFRQRSFSNASSASQSSAAPEYSQCYSVNNRNYTDDLNSDFDNIKLDDLSLGSDFIKEYLSPKRETGDNIEEEEMVCEDGDEKKAKSVTVSEESGETWD